MIKELSKRLPAKWVRCWRYLLLPTLLLLTIKPVLAHGEGRTLQREHLLVSTCYLTIWTAPAILRTGEVHVEVNVFNQDGTPTQAALVQVTLTPRQGQGPQVSAPAQPVAGMAHSLRTAAFQVQQAGKYRVTVLLTDTAGSDAVEFDVDIRRVPTWVALVIYSQLLIALLVGVWLIQQGVALWFGEASSGK